MADSQETNRSMEAPFYPPTVHLYDYLAILRRRKWVLILFFLFTVSTVAVYSFQATPVYQATAQIMIEPQASPLLDISTGENIRQAENFYQTHYNLLQSRSLARHVLATLNFDSELISIANGSSDVFMHLATASQEMVSTKQAEGEDPNPAPSSTVEPEGDDSRQVMAPAKQTEGENPNQEPASIVEPEGDDSRQVDWYLSNLKVMPLRNTKLVDISFTGSNPDLITRLVNAHAKGAVAGSVASNRNNAEEAFQWILKQLEKQKHEMEHAQREIYEYRKNNNLISLEGRQSIVTQALAETNSSLTVARTERLSKETAYNQLKSISSRSLNLFSLPEMAQDSVIQGLRMQLTELKAKKLELATRFGPKHPRMIEASRGIEQLEQDLQEEINRLKNAIKNEMERAVDYEQNLNMVLAEQKQNAMTLDEKAIQYEVLNRKLESTRKIYDALLENAKQIDLLKVRESGNIRIVDWAEVPRFPIKPRKFLNILMAVVLGLFMGTGLAFFVEYMDNTLKTPEDVVQRLNIPMLGSMPYNKLIKNRPLPTLEWDGQDAEDRQEEANSGGLYRIAHHLPTTLPLPNDSRPGQVIMVKSATMAEGKSTVLANMGITLSTGGLRTLVVDMDFQRPRQHDIFQVDNSHGLSDAMANIAAWKLDSGSLNDCAVADLFFLIGLKKQSGLLTVTNEGQAMGAYFSNGQLVQMQCTKIPETCRLGFMLLNAGAITKSQLQDALDRQKRSKQSLSLGYILVNAGYVGRNRMKGPLKVQTEEHLYKLFSWKTGHYYFKPAQSQLNCTNRIGFEEDYTATIEHLSRLEGSRLLENELLSRIQPIRQENLFVLTSGSRQPHGYTTLNLRLLATLMTFIRQRFDAVLLDSPPLDVVGGGSKLLEIVDGVVLVVKAGHLSFKEVRRSISSIPNEKIIGAILNQVKIKSNVSYY